MLNLTTGSIASILLIAAMTILQVLDIYTTYQCLKKPDRTEANKIMAFLIRYMGTLPALVIPKALVLVFIGWALVTYPVWQIQIPMGLVCCGYVYVVRSNWKLM